MALSCTLRIYWTERSAETAKKLVSWRMVSEGNCLYHWQQKERYVRIRRVDEYTCAKGTVSNRRDDEWSPGMYA